MLWMLDDNIWIHYERVVLIVQNNNISNFNGRFSVFHFYSKGFESVITPSTFEETS